MRPDNRWLLNQDKVWVTGSGKTVLIREMSPGHIKNLLAYMQKYAYRWSLEDQNLLGYMHFTGLAPWLKWLYDRPLYKALAELHKWNEASHAEALIDNQAWELINKADEYVVRARQHYADGRSYEDLARQLTAEAATLVYG